LDTTRQFIQRNTGFLTPEELAATEKAMEELDRLREQGSKNEIQAGVERLNEISRPYAERLMDTAVAAALKDKTIK
jgi:molecular chaperone HscA